MVAFEDIVYAYLQARKNKRRSHDSVVFELNQESNLVRLWKSVNSRTLDTTDNYTFVAKEPHIREIFATAMSVRIIHHYLEWRLRPIYEKLLPRNSFNNRKGMGLHKAIEKVRRDIRWLSNNYDPMADTWIVHLDFKGFFPNADVEIALQQQLSIIDTYYVGYDKDDLKYMMSAVMRADPARHCRRLGSIHDWDIIPNGKSLFDKPTGIGGAIGFLCWQNAMGIYASDVIKWLSSVKFHRVTVFVDDVYIVTTDKQATLSMLPELRERLSRLNVTLNENKFYCQHYSKGIMCLGVMLKYNRAYCRSNLLKRALKRVEYWNSVVGSMVSYDRLLCSLNTYTCIFRDHNNYKERILFKDTVLSNFGDYLAWNARKTCFALLNKFIFRNRMLKFFGKPVGELDYVQGDRRKEKNN